MTYQLVKQLIGQISFPCKANLRFTLLRLFNILAVKIPKIKICNPSPFRKKCFGALVTKQCRVLFEITFYEFYFY